MRQRAARETAMRHLRIVAAAAAIRFKFSRSYGERAPSERLASVAPLFAEPRALIGREAQQGIVGRLLRRLLHGGRLLAKLRQLRIDRDAVGARLRGQPHDFGADAAELG